MRKTPIAPPENVAALAVELNDYHECRDFTGASNMADIVMRHLQRLLTDEIHQ